MGLRSVAQICQRVTNAVAFILAGRGFQVINYLDDFAGAEHPGRALLTFSQLKRVLQECGLEESEKKAGPPSTRMEFLGIVADSVSLTLEIPKDKMLDITVPEFWMSGR